METIASSVRDLTSAFEDFKTKHTRRLDVLEKGTLRFSRSDVPYKANIEEEEGEGMATDHKNAFQSYIRKGDEASLMALECTKSLSVGSDVDGGYLVPHVISERIHQDLGLISPFRPLANVLSISSSAVEVLLDKGGEEAGWASETGTRSETETPKLAQKRIPVHELFARPRATQKLLDDAVVNIEGWLSHKIAYRMAQLENQAFISGDGNNQPRGFLSYPTKAREELEDNTIEHFLTGKSGAFAEEMPEDVLIDAAASLPARYLRGATWLVSRSAHAALRKLRDRNGQSLWQPALTAGAQETLLGYPVVIMEGLPELVPGTKSKSIVFGNFREAYQIVDRAGTYVLRDPYSVKPYIEFYTVKRVGGDVVNCNALKVIYFSE